MEYYSIFSHGELLDNKKLNPFDRKFNDEFIPIIMFGTQSCLTLNSLTLFYYIIFTKNYGIHFLKELVDALKQYPQYYAKSYQVKDETNIYQKAVRFLFDINLVDMKTFPANKFRLFIKGDAIRQPLDVFLDSNNEMVIGKTNLFVDYTKPLVDKKNARLDPIFKHVEYNKIVSVPMMNKITYSKSQYGKNENAIGLVYPYGLYKTTSLSTLEFQKGNENRLSQLTKEIIQTNTLKNKRKSTFRNPTLHEIGAIFVFSCKVSCSKQIRNFELPQQQQTGTKIPSSTLFKIGMNKNTNKMEMRSIPNPEYILYEHQEKISNHLKDIEKKRKERNQRKK
jgi:hypothetical protein